MRNAGGDLGENEWQGKKVNRNTYNTCNNKDVSGSFTL